LPEGIRNDASLSKYTSLDELANGHVNAAKLIGKPLDSLIEVPTSDDAAGRLALSRRLGAPEAADGYTLTANDNVAALAFDKPMGQTFLKAAADHGLHPEQAQGVYNAITAAVAAGNDQTASSRKATSDANINGLKGDWGTAYPAHVALVEQAIEIGADKAGLGDGGAQRVRDKLKAGGLATDPDVLKVFAFLGGLVTEAGGEGREGVSSTFGAGTPGDHMSKANALLQQSQDPDLSQAERRRLAASAQKEFAAGQPIN
jgi:hypothetical protein